MAKVRLKFNRKAFGQIINNPNVRKLVDDTGAHLAAAAQAAYSGPARSTGRNAQEQGYRATQGVHGDFGKRNGGRPVCYVHTYGWLGREDEARNKTLETHLRGGL